MYRVKKEIGEYSTYRGMANAFYKGTKVEELDRNVGTPHYTMYPESIQDVVEVVGLARKRGGKFVLLVQDTRLHLQTEEVLVSLDELKGIVNIDEEKMVAEVWAGTKLYDLGKLLEEKGYAQENLGILIHNLLQERLVRGLMERVLPLGVYQHKL